MSLNSDPKTVAGKIAHCSRSDCPPTVLAIGQGCLNQAIKVWYFSEALLMSAGPNCICGIQTSVYICVSELSMMLQAVAIARKFCMQPQTNNDVAFDLTCQPAFRENSQPNKSARCQTQHVFVGLQIAFLLGEVACQCRCAKMVSLSAIPSDSC